MRLCFAAILVCTWVCNVCAQEQIDPSSIQQTNSMKTNAHDPKDTHDDVVSDAKARLEAGDIAGAKAVLEAAQPLSSQAR